MIQPLVELYGGAKGLVVWYNTPVCSTGTASLSRRLRFRSSMYLNGIAAIPPYCPGRQFSMVKRGLVTFYNSN